MKREYVKPEINIVPEIWKEYIKTKHNVWYVSNYGRVMKNNIIIEPYIKKDGYATFYGVTYIHRAVAELFIPNYDNKPCVDHINTIKTDNRYINLRWCTYKENMNNILTKEIFKRHAVKHTITNIFQHPENYNLKIGDTFETITDLMKHCHISTTMIYKWKRMKWIAQIY